jgi:MFS family permease
VRDLYFLIALLVLNHSAFGGARVAVSLYAQSLGAEAALVGVLMALFSFLPMVASIRIGRWIDRVGVRLPMQMGTVMVAAGTILPAIRPELSTLYFCCVITGAGAMLFHVAANMAVGSTGKPEDRPINFSLLALGFSASGIVGPLIAGFGIDYLDYRWTFAILAVLPVIPIITFLAGRPGLPATAGAVMPGARAGKVLDLVSDPVLRRVYIASGLLSMGWDLFTFVIPIYGRSIGLSASTIGSILGVFAAATFFVRLFMPFYARRLSAWSTLVFSLIVSGATFVMFPIVESVPILFMLAFMLGIGLGCAQPMVMSVLYTAAPVNRRGEAVGFRTMLINISQTVFPLVFGALGSAVGITPVFWTLAASMIAGGAFTQRGARRASAR